MRQRILIVDDEHSIRRVLQAHLSREGWDVTTVPDGAAAISRLHEEPFHLVVTDLKMPGIDGMELLGYCRTNFPGLPVILITAHGSVDSAVEAIKLGAHDYVTKPFDQDELRTIIAKALKAEEAGRGELTDIADGRFAVVGRTTAMRSIYDVIAKVADSPTTVLVTGESGTGKELVARAIHSQSRRADGPFIQVNCGAIPENLFESELFGHEKGAFTGAVSARQGRFELADGGTLFLDEVGELPKDMQVKLLHVLQHQAFHRVGGMRALTVDVRLVAATNRDLERAVHDGDFREDLFYRLNVVPLHLPPLRERTEDIPLLVEHFVEKFNRRLGRRVQAISPEGMALLLAHRWPGNIRELENRMERAVLLAEGELLGVADLPGMEAPPDSEPAPPAGQGLVGDLRGTLRVYTAKLERALIRRVLEETGGNVTHASRRLGISRKGLQTKMKEYGLRQDEPPPAR